MNYKELSDRLLASDGIISTFSGGENPPPKAAELTYIIEGMENIMFPHFFPHPSDDYDDTERAVLLLSRLSNLLFSACDDTREEASLMAEEILLSLPSVKEKLIKDAVSIYKGDPAATSIYEIILSYPGFFAIMSYRIARLFYLRRVPYLPRMITERAHRLTGIDIHPGADIGESFCIDHGTGVVIGETATVGNRVKIYQGVTIGAKSFEPDGRGGVVKGKKRHPDIGDDCVIYAGATILGGDTVIGKGCVIGGNVWLTHSVPSGQRVYFDRDQTT